MSLAVQGCLEVEIAGGPASLQQVSLFIKLIPSQPEQTLSTGVQHFHWRLSATGTVYCKSPFTYLPPPPPPPLLSLSLSLSLSHTGDSFAEEKWFCGEEVSCQVCMFTLTAERIFDTKMSLASRPLCQFTTCSTVCSLSSPRGGCCHCMFVWSWSRNTAMAALSPRHTTAGIAFHLCLLSPLQSLSSTAPTPSTLARQATMYFSWNSSPEKNNIFGSGSVLKVERGLPAQCMTVWQCGQHSG